MHAGMAETTSIHDKFTERAYNQSSKMSNRDKIAGQHSWLIHP